MNSVSETAPPPHSIVRPAVWWICFVAAWAVTLALALIAALRLLDHDGAYVLIWLNAFTRYVYLPVYGCLVWSVWQRRWALLAASTLVASCHIAWMVPDLRPDRRDDSRPTTRSTAPSVLSDSIRIFFANVAVENDAHEALLQEIVAADPDVIVLVEYSWPWHLAFKHSPQMRPFEYGSGHRQSHIGSVNVFSKLPLRSEMQNWVTGRAVHTIDVQRADQSLRIIGLHGPRPMSDSKYNYFGYWEEMIPKLLGERGPLVIVGDFNATQHSLVYKRLTSKRLRSAHDARGRGYATTWPNGQYWLPPIRIDQVLISTDVVCDRIVEGRGLGSDHKPLVVDVRIRGKH